MKISILLVFLFGATTTLSQKPNSEKQRLAEEAADHVMRRFL
jgi:hypothetical protein